MVGEVRPCARGCEVLDGQPWRVALPPDNEPKRPDSVGESAMVTKIGERGQVGIRGASVTDEWEQLVKLAAARNGQTFADFIVDVTRAAALAIVKRDDATVTATLPVRIEDVAASLEAKIGALADEQRDRLERIERASRRGRWRR